ncbi:AMP-binding protein [Streptomyces harbinensis]
MAHRLCPLERLLSACATLMSGGGEASARTVAGEALTAYATLDEPNRLAFFTHLTDAYGVDADRLRTAYHRWEGTHTTGHPDGDALVGLFDAVEPARQRLLRRLNHAPGGTLALVGMRADLRRLLPERPHLRPLDHDFHHLLTSWFNRGFLRMAEVTWGSSPRLHRHLLRGERVHPMTGDEELRRRLQPEDRRVYAFFHPATGEVPLIFVEVALVRGLPRTIAPLLEPGPALRPDEADTAALYSINSALDGLAGISFGSFLIKQVIEDVGRQLPHLTDFVTLSPIPGFRRWLEGEGAREAGLRHLRRLLDTSGGPSGLTPAATEDIAPRLRRTLARYIVKERREDGRPLDPVARFHLGNGAAAWQLNWPADTSQRAWEQSYGAMINYRYEPGELERRHEDFVRHGRVARGGPLGDTYGAQPATGRAHGTPAIGSGTPPPHDRRGTPPMAPCPTIHRSFAEQAARRPDATLFELPGGRRITYRETGLTVQRIAARLAAAGLTPGDRVAAQVGKSPEAVALYLATLQLGGVFLPLNTAYTGAEMDYFLHDAEPRVLVLAPGREERYAARRSAGLAVETLGTEGDGTLLSGTEHHEAVHPVTDGDPAAILYTSGTTGRSKGAVLTHGNLTSNCAALLDAWEYTAEDRLIHALPIFHVHGLFVAVNMTLAAGASMYYLPSFDATAITDLLPRATVLMGVPTFYTRLLRSEGLTRESCAGMRLFVSGSAPLLASDHAAFEARTGHAIVERYGMTETNMNTTNPLTGGPRKPGTVGKPLPGTEVRVVDAGTGERLPDGEVGSIEVRGPNVFTGYWRMPEKTAAEFRPDGFFITGDLGRFDEDGYLSIVGRAKDLVISGGYNVYPKEIEELLDAHPKVAESAVIGVPHPDFGETVVAVVVPAPGEEPGETELLEAVAGDLARFKHPRAIRLLDTLPRNVMGKVQKAALREHYRDLFTDADA